MAALIYIVTMATLLSLAAGQATKAKCTQEGHCKCTFDDGVIDLSRLPGLKDDNIPWQKNKPPKQGSQDYVYSYKPCFDFNENPASVGGPCSKVASCQANPAGMGQYPLGDSASSKFMEEGGEIKLMHAAPADSTGQIRQTWVTLKCANSESFEVTGEMDGSNAGTSKYVYVLSSSVVCRSSGGGGSGQISIGTILCIVFLFLVIFYIIGGVLFMTFKQKAEGPERFPNLPFWKDLPLMIKDGACFAISPIRKNSEYSKM